MKIHFSLIAIVLLLGTSLACGSSAGGDEPIPSNAPPDQGEPFLPVPGIESITLLTKDQGVGEKPMFEWEPVQGAARYQLILYDEAGQPYWAWEGSATRIYIGGVDSEPPADSSGPSLEAGYSWAVMAFDANGKVIAASSINPISP